MATLSYASDPVLADYLLAKTFRRTFQRVAVLCVLFFYHKGHKAFHKGRKEKY